MAGDGQGSGRRRQQVPVPGGRQEWLVLEPDPGAETPLLSVGVGSAWWETTVFGAASAATASLGRLERSARGWGPRPAGDPASFSSGKGEAAGRRGLSGDTASSFLAAPRAGLHLPGAPSPPAWGPGCSLASWLSSREFLGLIVRASFGGWGWAEAGPLPRGPRAWSEPVSWSLGLQTPAGGGRAWW